SRETGSGPGRLTGASRLPRPRRPRAGPRRALRGSFQPCACALILTTDPWDTADMAQGDAERLRMGYAAFNHGGIEAILESLDPQIHVRERATMPDAATYHGRTGVRTLFTTLLEVFDDVQYEVEEIIERGDHSVVVLTQLVHGRGS